MDIDPNFVAKICGAASAVVGGIAHVAQSLWKPPSDGSPSEHSAGSRLTKKLGPLAWGACAFLATLIVVVVGCQMAKVGGADLKMLIGIGVFLFAVSCAGTWVLK